MKTDPQFDNLIAALIENLDQTSVLINLGVLVVLLALAIVGAGRVHRQLAGAGDTALGMNVSDWNRLAPPLLFLPMLLLVRAVLVKWQAVHLLNLAVPLALSFLAIQTCFYLLRHALKPSPALHAVERAVSWMVWGAVALHITGRLDDALKALDAVGFDLGKQHISLYTVFMGAVSLAGTLMFALWLAGVLEGRLIAAMPVTANTRLALSKLARTLFVLIAILTALPMVGIDITVLSVFSGALGVGLGLGLQKIAANYVSGFTLLLDQSVRIGDMVALDKYYGEVRQIGTRYTVIRGLDGTESIVPNELMVTSVVVNRSLTDRDNRLFLPIQVAYDTDLERARTLMLAAAAAEPHVMETPAPRVLLKGFGESGIDLDLAIWMNAPEEGELALRSDLYWAIWEAFKREGIEIPYPHRVVQLRPDSAPLPAP
ncbi:MAG: mechanosensitive ion channel [Betaproteobacteria bacterium]|nr:mechanosensitive ion channel [Betaproteobacteria bacterium]